ncbi:ion channel [Marinobacterium stanieri]|uniref:ion channel n=1 Tax=Marinobacterium stanieri TaxID=49186 RepID=UPI0002559BD7|nr:potassium channel family protein [Marinobacterium stanieri]
MNWLRKYLELIVLVLVLLFTFVVFKYISFFGDSGLWGVLITLCGAALFSSYRFFNTSNKIESLIYFLACVTLLLIIFTSVYQGVGLCCDAEGNVFKPSALDAWYFSIVTWTTLGYGDLTPPKILKPFAMLQAVLGQIFMAMIVGKTLFILQRQDKGENRKEP